MYVVLVGACKHSCSTMVHCRSSSTCWWLHRCLMISTGLSNLTFLTLIVKALRCSIWWVGLLMVHVLLRTLPRVMSWKSKDANWPGWQKVVLLAGSRGSSNSNVITSWDSCFVLRHCKCCKFESCTRTTRQKYYIYCAKNQNTAIDVRICDTQTRKCTFSAKRHVGHFANAAAHAP